MATQPTSTQEIQHVLPPDIQQKYVIGKHQI